MKIARVSATSHQVPYRPPFIGADMYRRPVFVRVETEDGLVGCGLTADLARTGTREFINRELGPFLVGKDPLDTERIWDEMSRTFNVRSLSGVVSFAIGAVDIALWDLRGKCLGQPVWRLLGGFRRQVPV